MNFFFEKNTLKKNKKTKKVVPVFSRFFSAKLILDHIFVVIYSLPHTSTFTALERKKLTKKKLADFLH